MEKREEPKEVHATTEIKVYNVSEPELVRLSRWAGVTIMKGGADDSIHWIEFTIPYTQVRMTYFN